ncbi:hypothetical protein SAMN05216262_101659 [Colwellia chukchiensis]|uniref:Alpha/beta hydrolase n=1 Tax=Colwellia chukchiensis TaxID=641665 RepID=A0A1H7HZV3_9GAMM|nr:alpha/beta hydrolase [Colwellia chukchiensis]SEK55826.1 hypothetical protein SAMN05216262_101659 [Colwellia chukchiensis]
MRIFSVLLFILLTGCSAKPIASSAQKPVCDLPYSPYQATVTGYCQEPMANLPHKLKVINKRITIKPLNEIPAVFWFNEQMQYSLIKQAQPAPVIFIIAGTGASFESAKMQSLQKSFYQQGMHVISLSSPTYANYIVNSSNDSLMPGDLASDAIDLYQVMQLVWAQVQAQNKVQASSFAITGYSLGGAHAAFVAHVDESLQVFNFNKVLLINPPVSLYNSVSILDQYFDLKNNRPAAVAMFEEVFTRLAQVYARQKSSNFSQGSIFNLFKDTNLSVDELRLLIGATFRMSLSDMIFALDVSYNAGTITYKNHQIGKFESLTHSMHRTSVITFIDYFEHAMLPRAQRQDASVSKAELIQRYSLHAIEDYLKSANKINVVTNADDIILQAGELTYLQQVFAERAKIFPRGGHCGNFDRQSFVDYLATQFARPSNK